LLIALLKGGKLHIYPYHEGLGKKGGNNVASMIMHVLESLNLLKGVGQVGKELNIIMDNCGGQNKNNHVLRLANLLVEAGYFHMVNFIFYVVGHTKNICDRWFNTLKNTVVKIYTHLVNYMSHGMKQAKGLHCTKSLEISSNIITILKVCFTILLLAESVSQVMCTLLILPSPQL
jgi:hypothetical protein